MQLSLQGVVKQYNGTTILNGVSASFHGGHCYLLLGQNGAGKSTLAKCIVGDEKVDAGAIVLNGSSTTVFDEIAMQYQSFESYKHLRIREIIQLFKRLTENAYYSEELYGILGIHSYERVLLKNASGGQRKAVSIFLAFLLNKPIILLDEPFADLDLMKKKQLLYFLQTMMQQQNKLLIIISHEIAEFESLFDYIYILDKGKIVEHGKRDELQRKYEHAVLPGIAGIYFDVTGQVLGGRGA